MKVSLTDFLTEEEMSRIRLMWINKASQRDFHVQVLGTIIKPNMERINKAIGQENDPGYLTYMIEYIFMETDRLAGVSLRNRAN